MWFLSEENLHTQNECYFFEDGVAEQSLPFQTVRDEFQFQKTCSSVEREMPFGK